MYNDEFNKVKLLISSDCEVMWCRISECNLVVPASIVNGVAVSKTFQILYRNEDVSVNDIVLFKVHMLVDSQKVQYCFSYWLAMSYHPANPCINCTRL